MNPDFAAAYADLTTWHWWFVGRARILSALLVRELGVPSSPRRIASIGCGPPEGLAWLVPHAGKGGTVLGVDGDPAFAARPAPPGVSFAIADASRPGLEPRSCDVVLCLDVIEHLDDDAGALAAAAAVVKPGGLLVVTVPAGPSLWGRQDVVNEHKRRYTRRTFLDAYARSGLGRPRVSHVNSLLFPPIAAARWGRRVLGRPGSGSDFDSGRRGSLNDVLGRIFAAERHLVGRIPLPFGVSLLGLSKIP